MSLVTSLLGSSIVTLANLRIKALSFSKYFLYSSQVVDATILMLPLVITGFNIFAKSFELFPPPAPAPLIMCASSMNTIVLPRFLSAANTSLNLSSKSPLYLEPANIDPMSKL